MSKEFIGKVKISLSKITHLGKGESLTVDIDNPYIGRIILSSGKAPKDMNITHIVVSSDYVRDGLVNTLSFTLGEDNE